MTDKEKDRLLGVIVGGVAIWLLLRRCRAARYVGSASTVGAGGQAPLTIGTGGSGCCDGCQQSTPLQIAYANGGLGNFIQGQPAPQQGTIAPTFAPAVLPPVFVAPPSGVIDYYTPDNGITFYPYAAGGFDQFTEGAYVVGKGGSSGV